MPFPRASQALSRFTVLDLTRVRSGPTCVRQLGDWGANIIKIEAPPHLSEGEGPGGPREGCGLAGSGLRDADDIAALQHEWNSLGLDRSGSDVFLFGEGAKDRLCEAEVVK